MLIIVLVVVVILTFAAYTFSELMITHYEGSLHRGDQIQTQAAVASGVAMLRLYLQQPPQTLIDSGGVYNNATSLQNVIVVPGEAGTRQVSVTVLAPEIDQADTVVGVRYGLVDESSKVNLHLLTWLDGLQEGSGRELLLKLPGMDENIADAILDWLDEDDEPRDFGAELEHYSQLDPPYSPTNGPLQRIEDLLLVRGVTPQLLFGADINRNAIIDGNEMSGFVGDTLGSQLLLQDQQDAEGNITGSLERGWAAYLTLYSAEAMINANGEPKIDINNDDLELLQEELSAVFPDPWTTFILAYRQAGPFDGNEAGEKNVTGDLDLTAGGSNKFSAVLDLIGAKTQVTFEGEEDAVVIASPFEDNPIAMAIYLPSLLDNVTTVTAPIPGRININQAPRAILLGIPGIEPEIVDAIMQARDPTMSADDANRYYETWLMVEGIVTLEEMKALNPYICGRGSVFRTQLVGYYQGGGASSRVEVVIDATGTTPEVLLWKEMSHLGRGYPLDVLGLSLLGQ